MGYYVFCHYFSTANFGYDVAKSVIMVIFISSNSLNFHGHTYLANRQKIEGEETLKTNEITVPIMLIIGIFGGLGLLLAMKDLYGGNWTNIAEYIAPLTIMLAVFAIVVIALVKAR